MAAVDPEILLLERELARRSYMDYARYVFKYIYKKKLHENWHHHYFAEVMPDYIAGKIPLLLVSIPPSYGKTEFFVKEGISFGIGQDVQYSNMYVSYGDDLSTKTSSDTKQIVEHGAYRALFPEVKITKGKDTNWQVKGGGGLFATTPTSATTGFHVKNIVIDDPIKTIEGHVQSSLKKVIDFWNGTIQSRLDDWGDTQGSIMIVMQRQDPNDLIGHIQKTYDSRDYVYICIEALNKEPKKYIWNGFCYERAANEPLFEAKHDLAKLLKMEKNSPSDFATQYQQDPEQSEAGFYKEEEDIHYIAEYDIPEQNKYLIVDNAESLSKKADDRAIGCLGYSIDKESQRELFVVHDLWADIGDEDKVLEEIIRLMKKHKCDVYIENKAAGITLARLLEKKIPEVNAKLRAKAEEIITGLVYTFSPKRSVSKEQKIMAAKTYTKTGNFKISNDCDKEGAKKLKKQMLAFNPDKTNNKDDTLDVTLGALTADFMEANTTGVKNKTKKRLTRTKSKGMWAKR